MIPMQRCSWRYKLYCLLLFVLGYSAFYILPNLHPPFQPIYLPLLKIDTETPLLPWTFYIYISLYLLGLSAIVLHEELEPFRSYVRMTFATLLISGSFFIFFPTQYPRPAYPPESGPLLPWLMEMVSRLDAPTNCFPSMHVAMTAVATWSLRYKGPKIVFPYVIWSLLIFCSTLTTKQHYFVDIIGGLSVMVTVAFLNWILFERPHSAHLSSPESADVTNPSMTLRR